MLVRARRLGAGAERARTALRTPVSMICADQRSVNINRPVVGGGSSWACRCWPPPRGQAPQEERAAPLQTRRTPRNCHQHNGWMVMLIKGGARNARSLLLPAAAAAGRSGTQPCRPCFLDCTHPCMHPTRCGRTLHAMLVSRVPRAGRRRRGSVSVFATLFKRLLVPARPTPAQARGRCPRPLPAYWEPSAHDLLAARSAHPGLTSHYLRVVVGRPGEGGPPTSFEKARSASRCCSPPHAQAVSSYIRVRQCASPAGTRLDETLMSTEVALGPPQPTHAAPNARRTNTPLLLHKRK